MKISKSIGLFILLVSLLALMVASQISQEILQKNQFVQIKITSITDKITLQEDEDCIISYYNETIPVYGYVPRFRDTYGVCFNATNQSYVSCVNGTESYQSYEIVGYELVLRNKTNCKSKSSYLVTINTNGKISKKEIDFSSWGPCIHNTENNCLIVTCVSLYDGAHNGKFTDCNGGKSCQKFEFCEDKVKVFYKNSREGFVEEDPTFYLSKLALKEVGK